MLRAMGASGSKLGEKLKKNYKRWEGDEWQNGSGIQEKEPGEYVMQTVFF